MTDETLADFSGQSCEWYDLPCHATGFATWLFDVLLFIPRKAWELLLDGLATALEAIPALPAIEQATSAMSAISGMGYIAGLVALKQGVAILLSTLVLRFLLRRIPGIG